MTNSEISIDQLILWISNQEDIPLETRIDMLAHWEKINHFDLKTFDYLSRYMNYRQQQQLKLIQALADELEACKQRPDKAYINQKLEAHLVSLVENFTLGFKDFESRTDKAEEAHEKEETADKVADLKASVGP